MIARTVKHYCCEDLSKIENYELAMADENTVWHCHHRNEITMKASYIDLTKWNLYYDRPAEELIFLLPKEHFLLHSSVRAALNKGTSRPRAAVDKMLQTVRNWDPEFKKKFYENVASKNRGKKRTEETRKKLSEKAKGRVISEETRKKISEKNRGKKHTEETKRKISESTMGRVPWNKGKKMPKRAGNKTMEETIE